MPQTLRPVCQITRRNAAIIDHDDVLGVANGGRIRKIIATSDHHALIDDDHLIVLYGVLSVDIDRDTGVMEICCAGVLFFLLALIKHHLYVDLALVGFGQGGGNVFTRKAVGVNPDRFLRRVDLGNDQAPAVFAWRKTDSLDLVRRGGGGEGG